MQPDLVAKVARFKDQDIVEAIKKATQKTKSVSLPDAPLT